MIETNSDQYVARFYLVNEESPRQETSVKTKAQNPERKLRHQTRRKGKNLSSRINFKNQITENTKMSFIRKTGRTKVMYFPWTTGQITSKGGLVVFSSGKLIPATSSTESGQTAGVALKAITATSDEYTTQSNIAVEVPIEKNVEWEATVTATLVATSVGLHCDLTDQSTVNAAASSLDICWISKFISTTKALVVLNIGAGAIKGQT